jgi:TetR/AcrR family transcriptional repressor of mexJK operon
MSNMGNRERLLAAATEVFLEHGYGASVEMLVQRAGVARQTFYNHFENKESLFAEAMRHCISEVTVPLDAHAGDVRETLLQFGRAYRARVLSPQSIAKFRIITAQAQRFPELTGEDYAQGLGKMLKRVARFLQAAMDAGQLRRDDAEFAAEMLLSMLAAMERARMLFGVDNPLHDEQQRVERIVDGFLRMFAPG